ncbi:MAG: histidine phosphatase family protein [Gammaproteobacteria bacterium]|jgi:phosphohistidine phosphatase|nr:MAG: histidine phosphatase family protein [Gammaproteobacteria bacterium]
MKLWLIRHAKSAWNEPGLADFDRPLNARGERDGPNMAAWLAAQSDPATWVWTSTAARARATATFVRSGFQLSEDAIVAVDTLYHASPEQILDVARQTPSEVDSVAIVAHNPGLTWLVNGMGEEAVTDNLPTFGVARFDCSGDWSTLRAGNARLDFLMSPKKLPG